MLFKDKLNTKQFVLIDIQKSAKGIVGCILTTEGLNNNRKERLVKSERMAFVKPWKRSPCKAEDELRTGKQDQ